jgi:hypothetical protein
MCSARKNMFAFSETMGHMTGPLIPLVGSLWDEAWMAKVQIIHIYVTTGMGYPFMLFLRVPEQFVGGNGRLMGLRNLIAMDSFNYQTNTRPYSKWS